MLLCHYYVGMFITDVVSKGKQGKSYTSILLRQSYRVGAAVKSKTLAVLTHLPAPVLDAVRRAIAPSTNSLSKLAADSDGSLHLRQAQSFGALCTSGQIAQQLGIKKAWGSTHQAQLGYWQVIARVLRLGTSLLAMVCLAGTLAPPPRCSTGSAPSPRTISTPTALGWKTTMPSSNGVCGKPAPPLPRINSSSMMSPAAIWRAITVQRQLETGEEK